MRSIPWGLRGCNIDTVTACSHLVCFRMRDQWCFLSQHNTASSPHMFQRVGRNRKEANQASLRAAEGLQIRGFAPQAASTASTTQSNQKRNPRGDWSESKLISPAMFPFWTFHFPNEDNGSSNELKHAEAKNSTFGVVKFYTHETLNVENNDIQSAQHYVRKQSL